jgi:hypothetical protein
MSTAPSPGVDRIGEDEGSLGVRACGHLLHVDDPAPDVASTYRQVAAGGVKGDAEHSFIGAVERGQQPAIDHVVDLDPKLARECDVAVGREETLGVEDDPLVVPDHVLSQVEQFLARGHLDYSAPWIRVGLRRIAQPDTIEDEGGAVGVEAHRNRAGRQLQYGLERLEVTHPAPTIVVQRRDQPSVATDGSGRRPVDIVTGQRCTDCFSADQVIALDTAK